MERSSVWLVATLAALILSGDPAAAQPAEGVHFNLGSAAVELGGQVRLRVEDDHAFDVRGYRPATDDRFLLSRVMLDASVRLSPRHRVFLELRDARQAGSYLDEQDFPSNNPFSDTLDIRQLFYEGLDLAGTGVSVRLGRQQMSYGDQRVFGPGQWGNTGRWAWDAALVNVKGSRVDADVWVGRPVRNRPDRWPNVSVPEPFVAAAYARALKLPMRLDLFYVHKGDASGTTVHFLPPYSYDFNPIESDWALIKKRIRAVAPRTAHALRTTAQRARRVVRPDHCRNWFAHAGYQLK